MQVKELMTGDPYGVQSSDTVRHAAEMMKRHGIGSLVVYDYDRPIGMITDRDIVVNCVAGGHSGDACPVQEHMTADPISISAEASINEALELMGAEQVRRLLVTDEGGKVAGIITLGDIAVRGQNESAVGHALKEISQPVRVAV